MLQGSGWPLRPLKVSRVELYPIGVVFFSSFYLVS